MIGLAFSLDLLIGEPPNAAHPVAWFGRLVDALDCDRGATTDTRTENADRRQRRAGFAIALFAPLLPAVAAAVLVIAATALAPLAGAVAAALVLFLSMSLRSLLELTDSVVAATAAADLETARERVRGLVGRETSTLSAAELRSAAVESAAENLADGLVATLVPFALLAPISPAAAAAAAAWVKGVNTLDSMLGYPDKPIGTASARLDDLVMWLPARLSAVAIAVAAVDPLALGRARRWARAPPSPNSGWPMATLACALDVRLRKPGVYDLNPERDLPTLADGERAVRVVGRGAAVAVLVAVALAVGADAAVADVAATPLEARLRLVVPEVTIR
ncbi:adenosylcobinamide-phosphate synthase CbiB [Halopiger xanaduensis]|uniref:Probable cobalamin biosynthesis protein CobD n=1 Tax=Halopiger xanaduensis (strain DSM 18323 / JCM 14033 / SH-6) TaxID=797210 RepID=F8D8B2_HALXS|nr:Cobalamin biosynthesis protein cbiB [Halopiger xanaduensis SH-6]